MRTKGPSRATRICATTIALVLAGWQSVAAQQAIVWDALRRCGVHDRIAGFGRLFREF